MPPIYDDLGVRFMYPENWQLTQEQSSHLPYEISLQTPGGGFWSLHIYDNLSDPQQLVEETLVTMRQEYHDLESEPIDAETQMVGYEMNFYCLDRVVTARAIAFHHGDRTCLVLYQAESSEFDKMDQVFQAVTLSLLRSDL